MMKMCSMCQMKKDYFDFHKMASTKDGLRPNCKDCAKESRDSIPILLKTVRGMADNLLSRTLYKANSYKNRSYLNVENRLGKTRSEIVKTILDNFSEDINYLLKKGEKPSIDRIDSKGHYEISNIQIIRLEDNVRKGAHNGGKKLSKKVLAINKHGDEQMFESISEASIFLNKKRDTILRNIENGTISRDGYKFKIIN